jgi:hypothetical protein
MLRSPGRAILAASFLLAGCGGTTSPGPNADVVVGAWEWSTACCGFAADPRTPATEGYTYVLQYSADGVVQVVKNNELIFSTHFTVTRSKPNPLADQITIVHYATSLPHGPAIPPADEQIVFKLENGTLVLQNPHCADCYAEWRFLPRLS